MILRQSRNNRRLIPSEDFLFLEDTMIWNNIYPAEAHKLEQFRKVARKSEEVGPPCLRETSQHFGGTCKPATVSKGYRSTKSLGNPALKQWAINIAMLQQTKEKLQEQQRRIRRCFSLERSKHLTK